jgi:cystathionine beta-lyase
MLILCSPHNPVGRVWTRKELTRLGEICMKNNVLVVSDEIHGDLILKGNKFTPFAQIRKEFAQNSVTCTAPSKTFNMAGLSTSNIIIPNQDLRERFEMTLLNNAMLDASIFGSLALETAYNHGEDWLDQVLEYLQGNLDYLEKYIAKNIPQIKVVRPEGTYLVWLDCRGLGLDQAARKRLIEVKARVYLEQGEVFSEEGAGFERMNIACSRSILKAALTQIKRAVEK